ncbi:MAG: hypothetical protein MI975_03870 [Cytophagales bacterium]|nr:hypothetical protein [Cytophagales bacterium]
MNNIVITGIGRSLVDYLYPDIDFGSPVFKKYESKFIDDGGISPGRLVFTHEFEQLTKKRFSNILSELTGGKEPDSINIGGPDIVSLIHASQILAYEHAEVKFFGFYGNDEAANYLLESLKKHS